MWKKRLIYVLIFFFIGFVGIFSIFKINQFKEKSSFTQDKWTRHPAERYLIVENMLKKYDFEKMTRDQVINLLGKSDKKFEGGMMIPRLNKSPFNSSDFNNIFYFTKIGLMPEDVSGIYIMFDEKGKVIDYSIVRFTT